MHVRFQINDLIANSYWIVMNAPKYKMGNKPRTNACDDKSFILGKLI